MSGKRWIIIFFVIAVCGLGVVWRFWPRTLPSLTQAVVNIVNPQPTIRFAVVGDNHGVNPIYKQIISDISVESYAFLLNLADTSERGTAEEWRTVKELESTLPYPVYHTVGSHDIKSDSTRASFITAFGHARWYAIDQGQLHLIILDNADRKVGFPSEELDWLEQDLAKHADTVNVIAYHRPFGLPLASLFGDDETKTSTASNERLTAILRRAKVAQIFTAHLHTYLPYTLAGIPAVVSGGGGDPAQFVLGGATNNYFHYLDVTIRGHEINVKPIRVAIQDAPSAE